MEYVVAFCEVCAKSINYKSNGKKSIRLHAEDETHRRNLRTVKSNQVSLKLHFTISNDCLMLSAAITLLQMDRKDSKSPIPVMTEKIVF